MKVTNKSIDKKAKNLRQPTETAIENILKKIVRVKGGTALKFVCPGKQGVPDRLCLLPNGKVWFVETKKSGKKPDMRQLICHHIFEGLGFKVRVISNMEQLKQFENEISAL